MMGDDLPRILIVDDDQNNLFTLHSLITEHVEVEILKASSGVSALEILLREKVDLILLDIQMPNMDGFETAEYIHARKKTQHIPIVFITAAYRSEEFRQKGFAVGAADYLTKPIDTNLLISRIKSYLRFVEQKQQHNQELEQKVRERTIDLIDANNNLVALNKAYERFVPRQFLHILKKDSIVDVLLGDHVQQKMSVLFSDIRDFTQLSESLTPADNFKFINAYLSRMEPIIIENQGFIDKYIGDAIMALFSGSADNAVQAGINMIQRLAEYNQRRIKSGYVPIQIGIGINTGLLMLGTVGGHNRMDGTVISDAVNLASRIESLTKTYGTTLLISHQTLSHLEDPSHYDIREMGSVLVKGKSKSVTVYEIFDADAPSLREGKHRIRELFSKALTDYEAHDFIAAAAGFAECLQQVPQDTASKLYFKRCQQFLAKGQSTIPN